MATQTKTYNVAGTYSWQCPPDVSQIQVEAWGAGGGAGYRSTYGGGGGGGGAYTHNDTLAVNAGQNYAIVVGAGGAYDTAGVAASSTFGGTTVVAVGGTGVSSNSGGAGGVAANCTPSANAVGGGAGQAANTTVDTGGGGGGSGGPAGAGSNGVAAGANAHGDGGAANNGGVAGGTAAGQNGTSNSEGGGGGAGSGDTDGQVGGNGGVPGGGGGGTDTTSTSYGKGGNGQIRITYTSDYAPYSSSASSSPSRSLSPSSSPSSSASRSLSPSASVSPSASTSPSASLSPSLSESAPTVALGTPADDATGVSLTPDLLFTGTDVNADEIEYNVQVDTQADFNSGGDGPLLNKLSVTPDATFAGTGDPHPWPSGNQITYSVQGEFVADSYSEANYNTDSWMYAGDIIGCSQSFTGKEGKITKVKIYLFRYGSPSGSIYAKIYAHTGTFGTSSKPTGAVLATSNAFNSALLSTTATLETFTFSGAEQIALTKDTKYTLVLDASSATLSIGNRIDFTRDDTSSTHAGNMAYSYDMSAWTSQSTWDAQFYIYMSNTLANSTTYYWRVAAIDPLGSNTYGAWSPGAHAGYSEFTTLSAESASLSPSASASASVSPSASLSPSASVSASLSPSASVSASLSPSASISPSASVSPSASPSPAWIEEEIPTTNWTQKIIFSSSWLKTAITTRNWSKTTIIPKTWTQKTLINSPWTKEKVQGGS